MISQCLEKEVEELKQEGFKVEMVEAEGWINLTFYDYPLPLHFNRSSTNLLLRLPIAYPNAKPDMFWVEETVALKDGKIPNRADVIETALEKRWRRFSWHPQKWNPGIDNLHTFLAFIENRLAKKE